MTRRFNLPVEVALLMSGLLFVPIMAAIVLLTVIGYLVKLKGSSSLGAVLADLANIELTLLGVALAFAALLYAIGWIWSVTITPRTLRTSTLFGLMRSVSWSSITSIRAGEVADYSYLVITSTESRWKLWLPVWMIDEDELRDYIEYYVDDADRILEMMRAALRG